MRYDKGTVKEFILNYHKTIENDKTYDNDIDIDDFFNVNDQITTDELDDNNINDVIFFNELESVVERVATEKEHNLFLLLCNGVTFEKVGNIFGVQAQRVRQMLNKLLDKLE
ncbi:sigma-70 family RNA polymerase sigma factor [Staphylococcus arlettae]|uniref:sigma-70 family RNA polymerase sigma factor n=1 Tax=Staphylococcus arlettae TaxID=29378 RepID=UPI001E3CA864|nr:sigma-70 family RNA polymerase sigma factor [Staphylococcus arlettae]MCD8906963.1 sigma-70 family RNA polymerase sigma factor [Staphylococcus arlettae]UXU49134.1 sigma-70 family RNA polymerase sigma factor [Staphylococcus arlettae]